MNIKDIEKERRYIIGGIICFSIPAACNIIASAEAWHGDFLADTIGQIIITAIAGGFLGKYIYWLRK